ncbi:MAG: hypothetical protein AAFY41_01310 [Bacteroidota bacterium]
MIREYINFLLSWRTIVLITLFVFSGLGYYKAKTTKYIRVTGFLENHEGPWSRVRGGKNEVFLKLYYSYKLNEIRFNIASEKSFSSSNQALEYLNSHDTSNFDVKVKKPFELIEEKKNDVVVYYLIMLISFFLLCSRFYSFKAKREFIPY